MHKRSFSIEGHRTSIAIEPEFWAVLEQRADAEGLSLSALIVAIDGERTETNLASACRLAALDWVQRSAKRV